MSGPKWRVNMYLPDGAPDEPALTATLPHEDPDEGMQAWKSHLLKMFSQDLDDMYPEARFEILPVEAES